MDALLHTPDGVRDIYGRECAARNVIEENILKQFRLYGYDRIETPNYEFFDVFNRTGGTISSREMFKFFDRDNNTLVLRPDITPAIARCVSKYFRNEDMPIRLCYLGDIFQNHKNYKGTLSESTQSGVELIGDDTVDADVEMIVLAIDCLLSAGLKEFQVEIGEVDFYRGLVEEAGLSPDEDEALRILIENRNSFGVEEFVEANITDEAAREGFLKLTELFGFNIPQRWSIAHLYQAILNGEEHVKDIAFLTTLAGYVHWQLSGEKVLGIGDASGMFPIDEQTGTYDAAMMEAFGGLDEVKRYPWKLADILPKPLRAGKSAGQLTKEGAWLLDPTGKLQPGALMAPPEGDAGTGMVATNAVRKRTGNISVGTSAFSMNVLDGPLKAVHRDIDIVTTPDGAPVAMVHTNNCSSDLNAWVQLFGEFAELIGHGQTPAKLYRTLFEVSQRADRDAGGLLNYSCLSGENITDVETGRPLFVRAPHSQMNLANFMLAQLYGCFAPLKIGMDILVKEEGVQTDVMIAQGGLFKTPVIGQQVLADCLGLPITVMETAGEGGPWGMAVLAVFAKWHGERALADFLDDEVFHNPESSTLLPTEEGRLGCQKFIAAYRAGLTVEREAGKAVADPADA